MPEIIGFSTRHNKCCEVDPGFTNQVGLLVIIEDGALELVVVWSISYGESQFLVPDMMLALRGLSEAQFRNTYHLGV